MGSEVLVEEGARCGGVYFGPFIVRVGRSSHGKSPQPIPFLAAHCLDAHQFTTDKRRSKAATLSWEASAAKLGKIRRLGRRGDEIRSGEASGKVIPLIGKVSQFSRD
ncbi:hypothetical protein HPP92_027252 [Vanilla planifolia]|uniref:Uncharacterized protein n=1 Tax=Vanilla planifolia TaxID=51239 RepID=A0A835PBM3_VANPL|nr:hypothetical protein HPP92_027252 [Vanilla planifolia]